MNTLSVNQSEALAHLLKWRVGALFMEPGTGKTRVALEIIRQCKDVDMVLWLGPLRTIQTEGGVASIADELNKWGGLDIPITYVGVESISCSDRIYMETRELLQQYQRVFCVVDESLKIKNADAKRTRHIIDLGKLCHYRIILNGTPLSRNIVDLWAQMEFLSHSILQMSHRSFVSTFCKTKTVTYRIGGRKIWEKLFITGYENLDFLYSLIRHYVYQCDLSLRLEQYYHEKQFSLGSEQKELYHEIKERYLSMEELERRNDRIFMEMTSEMQHSYCCCAEKMAVMDSLMEEIGQKDTIIFCRFIKSREVCERRYPEAKVLSYQKEALGLNLQDYHNTVYFDKVWDYALRIQASRRTFRTGQEFDCYYYDVTANTGLDCLIDKNINKKISMSEYFKKITMKQLKEEL